MLRRFEAWVMAKLVERRVRRALEPFIAATVATLVGQTNEGVVMAAPSTIVALVLGAQQEATESPESAYETEEGSDDPDEISGAQEANEPVPTQEPDPAEKRAALAAVLNRPEPAPADPDFAQILLAARGRGWE
jgi:hypothetical protein